MRSAGRRASATSITARGPGSAANLVTLIAQGLLIAGISGALLWTVWIYSNGLRDPRYLDGWVLAGGMGAQLYFHAVIKSARLSPKSAVRWRKLHILVGYVLVAVFLSHSDFSLPDSGFEWALWSGFVLVTLSGVLGAYLTWSLKAKGRIDESISFDRIPTLRAVLAQRVDAAVAETEPDSTQFALPGLPALPHDAWILDLYANHLRTYFKKPHNLVAHLIGSQRPLNQLIGEIDKLSRYVDQQSREKLEAIKNLVVEKDRLDFARVHLGLTRGWLLVHVSVTYALIVMAVLHVLVVYAFSSGAW